MCFIWLTCTLTMSMFMEAQNVKSHLDKFLSGLSDLQFDLTLALCPFFDRSVFCQSKREVLRAYIFFFYNMSVAFCCLCFPLVGGPDGLRKAGERNMESVNWALQRWSNPCAITSSSARSSASSGEWVIWWDFTGWLVEAHAAGDCHATSPTWASVSGNKPSSHTSIHM